MAANSKILILQIKHPISLRDGGRPRNVYRTRLYLVAFFVRFLRIFGYKFRTIDEAMNEKKGKYVCLTFDSNHHNLFKVIFPWLNVRNIPATLNIATDEIKSSDRRMLQEKKSKSESFDEKMQPALSWKNMRELVRSGWEIGTRGKRKKNLIEMSYEDQLEAISGARKTLIKKLGVEPKVFSYPKGAYDSVSVRCLRESGFKYGLSLHQGGNSSQTSHHHLKRLTVQSMSIKTILKVAAHAMTPTKIKGREREVLKKPHFKKPSQSSSSNTDQPKITPQPTLEKVRKEAIH